MDVTRAEVKEDGLAFRRGEEVVRLVAERIGNILILPARRRAAAHVTDARDSVDDRLVVLMILCAAPCLK